MDSNAVTSLDACYISCAHEVKQVEGVKTRLAQLRVRDDELTAVIERATADREAVRAEMASVNDELNALANAPVSGERDPTVSLPDEILELIFLMVSFGVLWYGVLERVCQRWGQIVQDSPLVQRRIQAERWAAYEARAIMPMELKGHTGGIGALALGLDGKIYSGSNDKTIRVWSGVDGALLCTLPGNGWRVLWHALAVGPEGKIYSINSACNGVQMWSDVDGAHLTPVQGRSGHGVALAVGLDGKIYSSALCCELAGSDQGAIGVWSGEDGAHLQTLVGHTRSVYALAVGPDGKIYSVGNDSSVRVWSGMDGEHLLTLEGPLPNVASLAVGPDGKIYTGSHRGTIRVWSGVNGALLQTLVGHRDSVAALAVGADGTLYSGSSDGTIRIWSSIDGTCLQTIVAHSGHRVGFVVLGLDGKLYSASTATDTIRIW